MNHKPRISVVIPLYNGKDRIMQCLKELDQQSISEPYEVIIVDDASPDDSAAFVEQNICKLTRPDLFRLIKCTQNGRAGKARNIGVDEANGAYVVFMDQDDYPHRDMLKILYQLTEKETIDLTFCGIMDRDGNIFRQAEGIKKTDITNEEKQDLMRDFGYVFALMIKKEVLVKNNLVFPEGVMFEDALYEIGLLACVNSINGTDEVLFYRYADPNSQTAEITLRKMEARIQAAKWYVKHYFDNPTIMRFRQEILINALYYIYLSNVLWMIKKPQLYDNGMFKTCLKEAKKLHVDWNYIRERSQISDKALFMILTKKSFFILKMIYFFPPVRWPIMFIEKLAPKKNG